jgi:hypothetical protein
MAVYSPSGSGQVHVDKILTQLSIEFPIDMNFAGEVLFPSVKVLKQSDKYYLFDRETTKLELHDVRAPGTVANEIPGRQLSSDSYYASEHALQIPVTDEERQNVDNPLTPDRDAAELVTKRILLGREKAMKDMATTAANYAAGHSVTLAGANQWDVPNYATSNPIADVRTAVRTIHSKLFTPPNTMIIPWLVMSNLEDHPDFIERIKYAERGILTRDIIGAIFGLPNIIVPGVGYSTAATGATASAANITYLWGKDVVIAWVPPGTPSMRNVGFGVEFNWSYPDGLVAQVDRWREEPRKSDLIRYSRRYDLKLIGHEGDNLLITAYLIKSAIA